MTSVLVVEGITDNPGGKEAQTQVVWNFPRNSVESTELAYVQGDKQAVVIRTTNREFVFWLEYPSDEVPNLRKALLDFVKDRYERAKMRAPKPLRATNWFCRDASPVFLNGLVPDNEQPICRNSNIQYHPPEPLWEQDEEEDQGISLI